MDWLRDRLGWPRNSKKRKYIEEIREERTVRLTFFHSNIICNDVQAAFRAYAAGETPYRTLAALYIVAVVVGAGLATHRFVRRSFSVHSSFVHSKS